VKSIVADKTTALTSCYGVLAALLARERGDGRGQRLVVPMLDSYAAFILPDTIDNESFPPAEPQVGDIPDIHRTWATLDGHVVMMIIEDDQFAGICQALEREDLIEDPRCANIVTRILHANEIFAILEPEIARFPTAVLVERARKLGAPLAPANALGEFIADPQVAANGTVFNVEHEEAGTMRLVRSPVRFSATPAGLRRLPPKLGAETDEILGEVGLASEEIAKLREDGTVL
jgi:crotonobetainyl-CoA:carnitine CoA-transferase CaiB-like acyl-CoA transferase